jgi:hypothetical protein
MASSRWPWAGSRSISTTSTSARCSTARSTCASNPPTWRWPASGTGGAHGCPPEDCGGPAGYAERRLEAAGFDALEDLATLADWVQDVVLDGKTDPLADAERLGDLEDALDRMKARQPYLADELSRRAVNARFRKGEHRDLMHQQF